MKQLLVINQNNFEPQDYAIRKVVRAVLLNEDGLKILFFGNALPGGGVEAGETDEAALIRECMEEVGAKVTVGRCLGEVVVYRDLSRQKYVTHAYVCEIVGNFENPTTLDPEEQKTIQSWLSVPEALARFESQMKDIESKNNTDADIKLTRLSRRKTSIAFLKEYENQN